jgi:hypothetical protein
MRPGGCGSKARGSRPAARTIFPPVSLLSDAFDPSSEILVTDFQVGFPELPGY